MRGVLAVEPVTLGLPTDQFSNQFDKFPCSKILLTSLLGGFLFAPVLIPAERPRRAALLRIILRSRSSPPFSAEL
jgi:hypothetical protein